MELVPFPFRPKFPAKTGAYTLTTSDDGATFDATGGAIAATLPTAASSKNKILFLTKIASDVSLNAITVSDGTFTTTLNTAGESISVWSDGSAWSLIQRTVPSILINWSPTLAGLGSCTNVTFKGRRQNNRFVGEWCLTTGTVTASTATGTWPAGITPSGDITNLGSLGGQIVGVAGDNVAGANTMYIVGIPGSGTFNFTMRSASFTDMQAIAGSSMTQNTTSRQGQFSFPVTGWN